MARPGGRGGREVGRTTVRVVPDTTRLRNDLRAALERTERTQRLNVQTAVDANRLRAQLRAAASSVEVPLRLERQQAMRDFVTLWRAFHQYARRRPVPVLVDLDARTFEADLARLTRDRRMTVTVDERGGRRNSVLSQLLRAPRNAFSGLADGLGSLAKVATVSSLALAGVSAALASTLQFTGGLVAALGQASGVVALLPALGLAGAAALGTLALAFTGLADAGGEAGQMRDAVKGLADEFKGLRADVQGDFFAGLSEPLVDLAQQWIPLLSTGLGGIAQQLNRTARGMFRVLTDQQSLADGATGLENTRALFAGIAGAAPALTEAFRDLAVVGSSFFPDFGTGIRVAAADFAAFIAEARASGELEAFISASLSALQGLGAVLVNTGRIFGSLFEAANASGTGFLDSLVLVTDAFAQLLASPQVQAGLGAFFTGAQAGLDAFLGALGATLPGVLAAVGPLLGTLTQTVGQVLGAAVSAIGPVITVLAPAFQQLATALGPALIGFFSALAPSLQAVAGSMVPVLDALAVSLPPMLAALAPVLGQLATAAAGAFAQLAVGLIPALSAMFVELLPVISALIPELSTLATGFIDQLLPVLPQIVAALADAAPFWIQLIQLAAELTPLVLAVTGVVLGLVGGFLRFITTNATVQRTLAGSMLAIQGLINWTRFLVGAVTNMRTTVSTAFSVAGTAIGGFRDRALQAFAQVRDGVTDRVGSVIETVRSIPGQVTDALGNLGSMLAASGRELIGGLVDGMLSKIRSVREAASSVAQAVKDFFPGSPVRRGPLVSHNRGGAGLRLGDMLSDGLLRSRSAVQAAARRMASAVDVAAMSPQLTGAGVAAGGGGGSVVQHITGGPNASPFEIASVSNRLMTFGART